MTTIDTLSKEEYEAATNFIMDELRFIIETLQKRHPKLSEKDIETLIRTYLQ